MGLSATDVMPTIKLIINVFHTFRSFGLPVFAPLRVRGILWSHVWPSEGAPVLALFSLLGEPQKSGQNIPINAPMVRIETRISSHELTRCGFGKNAMRICAASKNQAETVGMVIKNQNALYFFACASW